MIHSIGTPPPIAASRRPASSQRVRSSTSSLKLQKPSPPTGGRCITTSSTPSCFAYARRSSVAAPPKCIASRIAIAPSLYLALDPRHDDPAHEEPLGHEEEPDDRRGHHHRRGHEQVLHRLAARVGLRAE